MIVIKNQEKPRSSVAWFTLMLSFSLQILSGGETCWFSAAAFNKASLALGLTLPPCETEVSVAVKNSNARELREKKFTEWKEIEKIKESR